MQFKQGTHVFASDGQDVGSIDRVVLDPLTDDVSDLVVRKGWLFSEDKVVPIGMVASASEERVTLNETKADLQKLPKYEEHYYVPATDADYKTGKVVYPEGFASPVYGYPPLGTAWWGYGAYPPADLQPNYAERVQQNIPEGTVALKEGAHVLSLEDEHVGDVEEVFTDSATNHVTHLVISRGLLFKARKLIPTNGVKRVDEDNVMLTVKTSVVNALPEYEHQSA